MSAVVDFDSACTSRRRASLLPTGTVKRSPRRLARAGELAARRLPEPLEVVVALLEALLEPAYEKLTRDSPRLRFSGRPSPESGWPPGKRSLAKTSARRASAFFDERRRGGRVQGRQCGRGRELLGAPVRSDLRSLALETDRARQLGGRALTTCWRAPASLRLRLRDLGAAAQALHPGISPASISAPTASSIWTLTSSERFERGDPLLRGGQLPVESAASRAPGPRRSAPRAPWRPAGSPPRRARERGPPSCPVLAERQVEGEPCRGAEQVGLLGVTERRRCAACRRSSPRSPGTRARG